MNLTFTLFKREFLAYFRSPIAYVFLIVFLILWLGVVWWQFRFFDARVASMESFFEFLPWVLAIFAPAAGMRLWSEERKSGTWELVFTYPVTTQQAVIAKFLAGWAFLAIAVVASFPVPMTLARLGEPDWGPVFTGYLGAILLAGASIGICQLASSFTRNQVIAFVFGVIALLLLCLLSNNWLDGILGYFFADSAWLQEALANFGFIWHFEPMYKGLITVGDLVYFISIMVISLMLTTLVLKR